MDKGKDLQGFNRILDEREEYMVGRDRGVYAPFCLWEVYLLSKKGYGDTIHREMTF